MRYPGERSDLTCLCTASREMPSLVHGGCSRRRPAVMTAHRRLLGPLTSAVQILTVVPLQTAPTRTEPLICRDFFRR